MYATITLNMTQDSYPFAILVSEFLTALAAAGVSQEILDTIVIKESPSDIEGDFGFHCAALSKQLRLSPQEIAKQLVAQMKTQETGMIQEFVAVGPYVNAVLNYKALAAQVQEVMLATAEQYGASSRGAGERIIIDLSAPNIAKRMSVGHLRSTIIGDSLARILKHLGYEVLTDNHIGDWGTQFGHLLYAIELWGDEAVIAADPIAELQKLYVRISDAGEPDSTLYAGLAPEEAATQAQAVKDAGRQWFKKLEQGDPEARKKWQQIVDWSLVEFQKMYDILGVSFDWTRGEGFYEDMLPDAIAKVKSSGIASESRGALVVDMEDAGLGTAIIQKSDGATLYLTRDIATGIHRAEVEGATGMIYVVGEDQKLYFEQFFEILRRMGYAVADKSKHVYFGMIRMAEGKMSTRKGRVILLEDLVTEALERTRQLVSQRTQVTDPEEQEQLIRQVAVGSLKWNDLMADPRRPIVFDWDTILTMEGNSAPYVQYTYARSQSLLANVERSSAKNATLLPELPIEQTLVRLLAVLPESIVAAATTYNPSKIAMHTYELAKAFNTFYQEAPIAKEVDEAAKASRLALTILVGQALKLELNLLGIEVPQKM